MIFIKFNIFNRSKPSSNQEKDIPSLTQISEFNREQSINIIPEEQPSQKIKTLKKLKNIEKIIKEKVIILVQIIGFRRKINEYCS